MISGSTGYAVKMFLKRFQQLNGRCPSVGNVISGSKRFFALTIDYLTVKVIRMLPKTLSILSLLIVTVQNYLCGKVK